MATIGMCDRCDAVGLIQAIGTLVFHSSPNGRTTKMELCPECCGEVIAWIGARPDRGSNPAFRKSYDEMEWEKAQEMRKELESGAENVR